MTKTGDDATEGDERGWTSEAMDFVEIADDSGFEVLTNGQSTRKRSLIETKEANFKGRDGATSAKLGERRARLGGRTGRQSTTRPPRGDKVCEPTGRMVGDIKAGCVGTFARDSGRGG